MSPRRYRLDKRKEAAEATRQRIVEAVVELHAEQGVLKTTYAQVAERADVAVPTVYNHFPQLSDLLSACFGYSMSRAPPVGPQIFEGLTELDDRVRALVSALFAFYRSRGRALRWAYYESKLVPEMGAMLGRVAEGRRKLIAMALKPAFGQRPPAALLAIAEILLDFPAWQRLTTDENLPGVEAEATLTETLIALARGHAAAAVSHIPQPQRSKQRRSR